MEGSKLEAKLLQGQVKQLAKGKVADLARQLVEMVASDTRLQVVAAELVDKVTDKEGKEIPPGK
jgi:hypothetical protein